MQPSGVPFIEENTYLRNVRVDPNEPVDRIQYNPIANSMNSIRAN